MSIFNKKSKTTTEEKTIKEISDRQEVETTYVSGMYDQVKKEYKDDDVSTVFLLAMTEIRVELSAGVDFKAWYDTNRTLPAEMCKAQDIEDEETVEMFSKLLLLNLLRLDVDEYVYKYTWLQMGNIKNTQPPE